MQETRSDDPFDPSRRNAALGWLVVGLLAVLATVHALESSYRWFVFTGLAIVIVLLPAAARRNPFAMPSWELLVLVAIPVVDATVLDETFLTSIATYVAVAAVALVAVAEIDRFTAVRMTRTFSIALVVLTTLAVAATWNVVLWLSDVTLETSYILTGRSEDAANHAMMMDFVYAAVAGLLAGILFNRYPVQASPLSGDGDSSGAPDDRSSADHGEESSGAPDDRSSPDRGEEPDSTPSLIRGRFDVPERTVRRVAWLLQAALVAVLLYGLFARDVTTIANAGIALAITTLPAILERNYRTPLEPELVVWITGAVLLHALGSAGLYGLLGQWDSLTHALSASIVAGTGYAVVRAIDLHTDSVYLPNRMLFVFILIFVLAFGVVWELMEFALGLIGRWSGYTMVLAQHGITDTVGDLLYDLVGAVLVAVWGWVYLTDVSYRLADRLEARE
ncbi:hypothetical protein [Natronosalvus caseinilyticus]|uniref:hypothetical protein n=1 Tax=Natronosalvus caseinilyticus TaxID=2953747 RepID=UPI0028AE555E|nr:hypothetical protein [Natronosalvus caseinilyticus]